MPDISTIERMVDGISDVMHQRGLARQYSESCGESLEKLKEETRLYIVKLVNESSDSQTLERAHDVMQKISRLQMSYQSNVAPPELERRLSVEKEGAKDMYIEQVSQDSECPMEVDEDISQVSTTSTYSWGRSDLGALLHSDLSPHQDIKPVDFVSRRDVLQVSSNFGHTAVVTTTGELYLCGSNEEGQVTGSPSTSDSDGVIARPRQMEYFLNHRICAVACGSYHTICVNSAGVAFAFGSNEFGQLGHGSVGRVGVQGPRPVEGLSSKVITTVACGDLFSLFLAASGEVFSCGENECIGHAEGSPKKSSSTARAERVEGLLGGSFVVSIAAGSRHSMALTATGEIYGWGNNKHGELGVSSADGEDFGHLYTPNMIPLPFGCGAVAGMSAGERHSLLWTDTGVLLGCGSNKHSQLGCNTALCLPAVENVGLGMFVKHAACGSNHSVVLCIESMNQSSHTTVITFGQNNFRQCGVDESQHPICRSPVTVTCLTRTGVVVVAAGGCQSFAVAVPGGTSEDATDLLVRQFSTVSSRAPKPIDVPSLLHMVSQGGDIMASVAPVFSSASLLGASFLHTTMPLSLDILGLENSYNALIKTGGTGVSSKLLSSLEACLADLEVVMSHESGGSVDSDCSGGSTCGAVGVARALLMILQCPLLGSVSTGSKAIELVSKLCILISRLSKSNKELLVEATRAYPAHIFRSRLLAPLQDHLTHHLSIDFGRGRAVPAICAVLKVLHDGNERGTRVVPYEAFYNDGVNKNIPPHAMINDYHEWKAFLRESSKGGTSTRAAVSNRFFFSAHSFLISVSVKRSLLLMESALQQQNAQHHSIAMGIMGGGVIMPYLTLLVDRSNLLQSAMTHIENVSDYDLKKPLKVVFMNEEGLDEGGVRKEFFQLLLRELLDPRFGLFVPVCQDRFSWINKACTWSDTEFSLVGVIVALAVYNDIILDLHMPRVIFKKILHRCMESGTATNELKVSLDDIADLDPELYRGFKQLLDYSPPEDVEGIFCRSFEVTWEEFGVTR